ncbi:YfbM family protein [Streptomyces sp. HC307]|uniref:YfbM family protein n=1 Tax=Streptomyces flavusporus TaxID=3385496 RepID=UPI003916DFD5
MSMIGEYVRLTPAELDRAVRDPDWAHEFVDELIEAELDERPEVSEARCHDTDKAWHALDFLLRRLAFPVDIVHGEEEIPGAEDWGYGPPRYLTPEQVRAAADALMVTSHQTLIEDVTPADLAQADIYPNIIWEHGESLDYVTSHYQSLVPFFQKPYLNRTRSLDFCWSGMVSLGVREACGVLCPLHDRGVRGGVGAGNAGGAGGGCPRAGGGSAGGSRAVG